MKNKIIAALGNDRLDHRDHITYPQIYVMDWTQRTSGATGLEIHASKPQNIPALLIENPNLDITATFFKPHCFIDEDGYEPDNCEGVFYLTDSTDETWVLFVEIKDCKSKNISTYYSKTKEQIIKVVAIFRARNIIAQNKKVYANISFPRSDKINYYNQLIKNPKEFRDKHKIILRGTNTLRIKNNTSIF